MSISLALNWFRYSRAWSGLPVGSRLISTEIPGLQAGEGLAEGQFIDSLLLVVLEACFNQDQ